jgi:stage V sporulation protein G
VKATASVDINGQFAVRSVKVMEGSNGLFVSVPSYKNGNGEYKDIAFPCTKEAKAAFDKAVMGANEQALTQSQSSVPSRKSAPDPFEQPAYSGQKM